MFDITILDKRAKKQHEAWESALREVRINIQDVTVGKPVSEEIFNTDLDNLEKATADFRKALSLTP